MSRSYEPRRAPLLRMFILFAVIVGLSVTSCAGVDGAKEVEARDSSSKPMPWFAGYVDITVPSAYEIDKPPVPAAASAILSFIVAHPDNGCVPSWGGYHNLEEAETKIDLDSRISRLRENGGDIVISFGGQLDDELATVCRGNSNLAAAYRGVIERYEVDIIDLDIEGNDLGDEGAGARRAEVVAGLQDEREKSDPLRVWVTLPVTPQGLNESGRRAVAQMVDAGVSLAGVNIMTMNYGGSRAEGTSMLEASKEAARRTHTQLGSIYQQAGQKLDADQLWHKIGLTPMIGDNDVAGDVIDLATARGLNQFARERGIGRISLWSLNRDRPCSGPESTSGQPSNVCSGIKQERGAFSRILGHGYSARLAQVPG